MLYNVLTCSIYNALYYLIMFYNALAWFILFDALYCSTMFSNVFLECGIVFFDFNVFNALYCLRMRFNALQQRFCF